MVPNPIELRAGHAKAGRRCRPLPAPSPIELRMGHANTLTPASRSAARDRSGGARRADLSTHALSVRTPTPARPRSAYRCRSNRSPTTAGSSHRCLFGPHAGTPPSALMPVPLGPHTDKVISPGMKHSRPRERTLDEGPHPIPHNKRGGEHEQTRRHQRRYRALSRHRLSRRIHLSAQPGRRGRRHARCLRQAHTFLP